MTHDLITSEQRALMLAYGLRSAEGEDHDPHPVVKLFIPGTDCVWLLTELDPEDPDIAFGLCDLGMGFPELGSVRLSEIASTRELIGVAPQQDRAFRPDGPLSAYAARARAAERIVT